MGNSLRIAVLNPYSGPVAEAESIRWLAIAAAKLGHEVIHCHDEQDINECRPDFVLNMSFQNPKLTRFPTYGLLNLPTEILESSRRFIRNVLSYDAVYTVTPGVKEWYERLSSRVRKPALVFPLAVTTHAAPVDGEIEFATATIAYAGTNWDGLRLKEVFEILAASGEVLFYGPARKWKHVDQRAVKGEVPFDGKSLLRTYRRHGIALALSHPQFVAEQIPNNRIFEGSAAGALVISSDYALVRDWFGDSFLYVDQTQEPAKVAEEVLAHLAWVRRNPEAAQAKARAANAIFRQRFAMEKMLAGAVAFHGEILARQGYVAAASGAKGPRIAVVVRASGCSSGAIARTLESLTRQSCSRLTVLLAIDRDADDISESVCAFGAALDIRVIECAAGGGSRTLWPSLPAVDADYFTILKAGDECYPNHFALLLGRIETAGRATTRAIRIVGTGTAESSESKTLHEREEWHGPSMLATPHSMRLGRFSALSTAAVAALRSGRNPLSRLYLAAADLLDQDVLRDPGLESGEELYLLLCLLAKGRYEFSYAVTACSPWIGQGNGGEEAIAAADWRKFRQLTGQGLDGLVAVDDPLDRADPRPPDAIAATAPALSLLRRGLRRLGFRPRLPADFDAAGYLRHNPDVAEAKSDPVRHFLEFGYREGRRWR